MDGHRGKNAVLAQSVARRLGKAEVGGSSPLDSFLALEQVPRSELRGILDIGKRDTVFGSW